MKINGSNIDLYIVVIITLLLIPVVIFSRSIIPRIIFGLPLVIFSPGFALISALFPAKTSLSTLERIAYSLALSIAIVVIVGIALNSIWSITLYPMTGCLAFMTFIFSTLAWVRRRRLSKSEKTYIQFKFCISYGKFSVLDKILMICLGSVMLGAIVISVYTYQHNQQGFTEFYLLGSQGQAANYPQQLFVGQEGQVTMILVNQEKVPENYTIKLVAPGCVVKVDGIIQPEINISLKNGEQRSFSVEFSFSNPGTDKSWS